MTEPRGPGAPFTPIFDEQPDADRTLPASFAALYNRWPLPEPTDRPFVYSNFVMSHDGRVSFNEPGHAGGGDVSRRDAHDRWLMGLLRARADAVLVGGSSIEAAGNHVWTPAAVFAEDAQAFAALREQEGRAPAPLLVVLTRSGAVPEHAPSLDNPGLPVLIATTSDGAGRARRTLGERDWVRYLATGATLDTAAVMRALRRDEGVRHLLCEGGPQINAALIAAQLVDDAFVTLSPIIIGRDHDHERPSLTEGVAFGYDAPPQLTLLSMHRHGSYLYLHSRYATSVRS
jgi:5-amino-6-(5-phosphoribosylamino)uracil reductase